MRLKTVRTQRAGRGERHFQRLEKFAQVMNLLDGRFVMDAIDQRERLLLKRFGGGDIGEDHEFLDQPVRVEALGCCYAIDRAVGFQQNLALGQIEIERVAFIARVSPARRPSTAA
jgi:hypothetical protein